MLPASTRAVLDAASTPMAVASFEGSVLFTNVAFQIATNLQPPEHMRELLTDSGHFDDIWQGARAQRRTRIAADECCESIALRAPVVTRFRANDNAPWQFLVELVDAESAGAALNDMHDRLYDQLQSNRDGLVLERMTRSPSGNTLADPVTGVASRRALDARLKVAWHNAMMRGTPVSLLLAAIDNADDLVGTPGAAEKAASALTQALLPLAGRDSDLVARHDTNSFAVLLTGADERGATRIGARLEAAAADAPYRLAAGMATLSPATNNEPATLVQLAEDALVESRTAGAARCAFRTGAG